MRSFIEVQRKLLPDLMDVMQKRYHILRYIKFMQPVGRRNLAISLSLTERTLRAEVEFLKTQNLIDIFPSGMQLTEAGLDVLEKLDGVMRELTGIDKKEDRLAKKYSINEVIIVSGNSDTSPWVKAELGKECASCIKRNLSGENIIAVTGGSTLAAVADMLTPDSRKTLFVPARGGLGEDVHNQANTIAANMAAKMNSSYRVLYVPEQVSKEAYLSFMKEPAIKEVISLIKTANIVVHGIGDANVMAGRRKSSPEIMMKIKDGNAVGEAFGYYFNEKPEIVHKVHTVGIQKEDLDHADSVIAVAGGSSKAKAIRAYLKMAPSATTLITDESVANELLKG
ncbi:central glycolytic genes regulator [Peribacillus deserti]|uniref:Central glycolytic genes regulator n=1 Tax=Peribacillus deserti TaxID=673318 RepID=A0ABS2QCX1_9BACI|nr:sugar-binding domain-containing protein [Peribacillus deserti]MBM7690984.1 central glycolytic genes regulator [Peribacillus deserti]